MRLLHAFPLSIALAATLTITAQTPAAKPQEATANASSDVTATVIVHDKKGDLLNNLTQSDFSLQADRKPQTIHSFDHATNSPLTIGILVDTSHSKASALDDEREPTATFLDKILTPGNKAFLVQFDKQVQLVEDVTDSRPTLQKGLKDLTAAPATPITAATVPDNSGHGNDNTIHGGTTLYDAIFLSTDEITAKSPTRRALILFSDGIDRNSKEVLDAAIEAAQRADTTIYAIYIKPDERRDNNNNNRNQNTHHFPGSNNGCSGNNGGGYPSGGGYPGGGGGLPGGGGYPSNNPNTNCTPTPQHPTGADHKPNVDGHAVLDRICGETGGRVFDVSRHDSLDHIYGEIAEELHSQYRITFTPTALDTTRDHYHEIDLTLTGALAKSKATIQTRDGFFNGPSTR